MSVPRYWREIRYRYRLIGERCTRCGGLYYPRRAICPRCGSRELEEYQLSDRGRIVSWTVIRNPPKDYERFAPYVVALVELEDGVKILSQIVDVEPEEVKAGMRVEATFRKIREDGTSGIIEYGYKFRPPIESKQDLS
ncbi:MAG: Zn-ribbon domain-containing OB-fold protein [Candidatus Bathyarchaeia archaeon]